MPLPRLPVQMTKYVNPYGLSAKIDNLIAARSLPMQALTKLMGHGKRLIEYLKQPRESEVELLNTHRLMNRQMSRS